MAFTRLVQVGLGRLAGSVLVDMGIYLTTLVCPSNLALTSNPKRFPVDSPLTPEAVRASWGAIINFDDSRADHPESPQDGLKKVMQNMQNRKAGPGMHVVNRKFLDNIEKAKEARAQGTLFEVNDKEVILYNLGIGAKKTDLKWVFEGDENFEVLPTFGKPLYLFPLRSQPYQPVNQVSSHPLEPRLRSLMTRLFLSSTP